MSEFIALEHETPAVDLEALGWLAEKAAGGLPDTVALEVGSWTGRTALVLATAFDTVFCVDHFLGNPQDRLGGLARKYGQSRVFRAFCTNMGPLLCSKVYPCWGASRTWAESWTRKLDFVFIDASHTYRDCRHDIEGWSRHVRKGGIVAVHDYGEFEGVTRAVDELMPRRTLIGATIAYQEVR